MKWMTDAKQTVTSSLITGYQPTRHSAINSQEMQDVFKKNRLFKIASDQMEFASPRLMELAYYEIGKILIQKFKKHS